MTTLNRYVTFIRSNLPDWLIGLHVVVMIISIIIVSCSLANLLP
jgi:uncharacterized protein involved in cysteine biosynthesis